MATQTAPRPVVPWNPLGAALYVIGLFFGTQFIAGVGLLLYGFTRYDSVAEISAALDKSIGLQFVATILTDALMILGVMLWLRHYKSKLSTIGLKKPQWRDLGYGLLTYLPYFITFLIVIAAATKLLPGLDVDQKQELGFDNVHGAVAMVISFVSLVILPPLIEETLVRGLLFTSLRKWLRLVWALLITSFLFAIAHLPEGGAAGPLYIGAIDTFLLSVYLCVLREKTGSLWAGITLHALKNLVAFLALFVFTKP